MSDISVIYEDADLAVINKPPGVTVNNAITNRSETIQQWWQAYLNKYEGDAIFGDWNALVPPDFSGEYGSPVEIFQQRGGVVHRLD